MKILAVIASLLSLVVFSSAASAIEKVTISGSPVVVEKQGDVFVPSTTVTTGSDYYYFTMDNANRVCYRTVRPGLAKLDAGVFRVRVGNDVVSLHCYNYDTEYFMVQ